MARRGRRRDDSGWRAALHGVPTRAPAGLVRATGVGCAVPGRAPCRGPTCIGATVPPDVHATVATDVRATAATRLGPALPAHVRATRHLARGGVAERAAEVRARTVPIAVHAAGHVGRGAAVRRGIWTAIRSALPAALHATRWTALGAAVRAACATLGAGEWTAIGTGEWTALGAALWATRATIGARGRPAVGTAGRSAVGARIGCAVHGARFGCALHATVRAAGRSTVGAADVARFRCALYVAWLGRALHGPRFGCALHGPRLGRWLPAAVRAALRAAFRTAVAPPTVVVDGAAIGALRAMVGADAGLGRRVVPAVDSDRTRARGAAGSIHRGRDGTR